MGSEILQNIETQRQNLAELSADMLETLTSLEGAGGEVIAFNLDAPVGGTSGTVQDMISRLNATLGLAEGIGKGKPDELMLVPTNFVDGIESTLANVANECQDLLNQVQQFSSSADLTGLDENLILTNAQSGELDLGALFQKINTRLNSSLDILYRVHAIVKPHEYNPFLGALEQLSQLINDMIIRKNELRTLLKTAKTHATQISNKAGDAGNLVSDIEALEQSADTAAQEVETAKNDIETKKTNIDTLLTDIQATEEKAGKLDEKTEQLQSSLENFESQLQQRETDFTTGKEEFDKLRKHMEAYETELNKIENDAKDALGRATVAGLAKGFSDAHRGLTFPLVISQLIFYASIGLLLFSVAVAFNAFPQFVEVPNFAPPGEVTAASVFFQSLTNISFRVMVLVPGLLLAGFASRWHKRILAQKELYAFKKTVAVALPGFKAEVEREDAHEYSKAMTAEAFERLLFNPQEAEQQQASGEKKVEGFLSKMFRRSTSD